MAKVGVEAAGHTAIVTLDNGPLNLCNFDVYTAVRDAFNSVSENDDFRVAVFSGQGDVFSAGNDVKDIQSFADSAGDLAEFRRYIDRLVEAVNSIYTCRVPVVGAIHGWAVGAGLALASVCDVLVAAEGTQFSLPEIRVGVIGANPFARFLVPEKIARYMSLSGDAISVEEIARYGGINKIVPAQDLLTVAGEMAERIARHSPTALKYYKESMNLNADARLDKKYYLEIGFSEKFINDDDFREACTSFLEKRNPDYTGK